MARIVVGITSVLIALAAMGATAWADARTPSSAVLTTSGAGAGCFSPIGCSDPASVQPGTHLTLFFALLHETDGADTPPPTGRVAFADNGAAIGTVALNGHLASLATPALSSGRHAFTATYSGDTHYQPTSVGPVVVDVAPAPSELPPPTPVVAAPDASVPPAPAPVARTTTPTTVAARPSTTTSVAQPAARMDAMQVTRSSSPAPARELGATGLIAVALLVAVAGPTLTAAVRATRR